MNNSFLNSNQFSDIKNQQYIPLEKSYIENILRLNKGKKICIYQSFPNTLENKEQCFNGILEECGKDHIILSDPSSGNWYLLLMNYVDFIKFDEDINTKEQFYSYNK